MLYRITRAVNDYYGLAVFGFFLVAFFAALAFTMIYPIVPFALLFISIFLVVIFWIAGNVSAAIERRLALRAMARDACPSCDGPLTKAFLPNEALRECEACRIVLHLNGEEWTPELGGPEAPSHDETVLNATGAAGNG
ncbi:MAG: hypothetical protein U0572_01960 [Phycisphaerales bacterium]